MKHDVYEKFESKVRSYCRAFPVEFKYASGSFMLDHKDNRYLDFLSGCGSLNYGHNHEILKKSLIDYISSNGLAMGLDFHSSVKSQFLESFYKYILEPRGLNYIVQFTGPTGANAVEAAIKLARKVTGRTNVISFTNGFHGCSLGALALTGNSHHREGSKSLLTNVTHLPYDKYLGGNFNTADLLEKMLKDQSSGIDKPAAIVLETLQGEGGINEASQTWIEQVYKFAHENKILLIIDEIQTGCGRCGDFFSFERFNIQPDIIMMAKSISGYGLPMSINLIKPEYDVWNPGEHNGTFRGNSHAFVTAASAINEFWRDDEFKNDIFMKSEYIFEKLKQLDCLINFEIRGRGLMIGIDLRDKSMCESIKRKCFDRRLILESCGADDQVLKIMPPLTISKEEIDLGITIINETISNMFECNYQTQKKLSIC